MNDTYDITSVEIALSQQAGVQQAVVVVREDVPGQSVSVAYLIADRTNGYQTDVGTATIREAAEKCIPAPLRPAYYIWIKEFPRTAPGAIDKTLLPIPEAMNPAVAVPHSEDKTIIDLFHQQVQRTPDAVALLFKNESITYRDLDAKANQLAHYLTKRGVTEETLVAICVSRSSEMMIGILGILKAGAAYVPVDPEYPADRIHHILSDTRSRIVVTDSHSAGRLTECNPQIEQIRLDSDWAGIAQESRKAPKTAVTSETLAYVIYTSGSTGRPKGVMIEHRSIANYIKNSIAAYSAEDKQNAGSYLHLPLSFDASLTALFVPLLTGKCIVINSRSALDAFDDENLVQNAPFDFLKVTPAQLFLMDAAPNKRVKDSTKTYVVGGEALHPRHFQFLVDNQINAEIINEYGPTEATVGCVTYRFNVLSDVPVYPNGVLIGKPMPNVTVYVLDASLTPVPAGAEGELYISGVQVARGYLNQAELTNEKFLPDPFSTAANTRMYKSGDLVRLVADGNLEFLGRVDEQVKIRGYRIELGEIEHVLQQFAGVNHCVVATKESVGGDKRLIGYVVPAGAFDKQAATDFLQSKLPAYMVPQFLVELDQLPLTNNGKVNRNALPDPDVLASLTTPSVAPTTSTQQRIAGLWADVLTVNPIGIHDNFFELGGNSLLAAKVVAGFNKQFHQDLSITKLYQFPTVSGLADYLTGQTNKTKPVKKTAVRQETSDVAVIGMAGRFPGANTIDELWTLLREGRETISFFADAELDPSLPGELVTDPTYVKARGVLSEATLFDAGFFGLTPKLAELMDPQQRIFLEIAWEALEQTGYLPQTYDGTIGVYAGCGNNTYYLNNVLGNQRLVDQVGSFQVMTANEKDYVATRTAYQLNLKGPAVSVHSACSTSLLAIAQAVDSIRNGQCEVALAGGSSITSPINSGHLYEEGAILSRDGHCRSFDADAQGTVFSDGAGVVLLKSLEAAKRDGDTVYAVIKGTGVNNDGGGKGSFTAPNADGQAGAIRMALNDARIDSSSISYVEAHGTATPIGDPIEIEGLTMAFGPQSATQFCAIGSIKSNMGHLTAAAGVAGFIKTTLALYHRQLPPSVSFSAPSPLIDFTRTPFFVNTKLTNWPLAANQPQRRAGISSFGVGGTNVHVVLEEFTPDRPATAPDKPVQRRPLQIITWSAKSAVSRDAYAGRLADYVRGHESVELADIAFTLQTTRAAFGHRQFVLAATNGELVEKLSQSAASPTPAKPVTHPPSEVVFLFPGQGSQYLNMGGELYRGEPVYRQAIDECAELLMPHLEADIRRIIFPDEVSWATEERLKNTRYTQSALFVTEYALAKLWMSWGIEPSAFCGHSIGEFVAAHLAGVFTLPDVLKLIALRGRLVGDLPRGSMLSVRLEADKIGALMPEPLSVAVINSHKLCVVAGHDEDIAAFASVLDEKKIPNRVLATSHAFHSAMMDPAVADLRKFIETISLNRPRKPIMSTVSGVWLTDAQATDPVYWAKHVRLTVRFADALDSLLQLERPLLLEVGPGTVTTTLARQQAGPKSTGVLASLDNKNGQTDYQSILKTAGQLWLNGLELDWAGFYQDQNRVRVSLPTYAFDKKHCWVELIKTAPSAPVMQVLPALPTPAQLINIPLEINPHPTRMRQDVLLKKVKEMLEDASGLDLEDVTPDLSFLEVGLDSLLLTQVSIILKKEFGLPITFRQLNEEYATFGALINYLDSSLPAGAYEPTTPAQPASQPLLPAAQPANPLPASPAPAQPNGTAQPGTETVLDLMAQQLQLLSKQIAVLQSAQSAGPASAPAATPTLPSITSMAALATQNGRPISRPAPTADLTPEEEIEIKKPFGASARIERHATELSAKQTAFIQALTRRYNQKTAGSKTYTQQHRDHMADPRVVSGFKPLTKELVYPIVIDKSNGSRLWDVDGNEYLDMLNGFGSNMFGYQPDFIKEALYDQIEKGFEVGPQHALAGEVSQLICDFTGFDRSALCSTGSEAVLGAMRVARTVTGRSLIVAFSGSYHGIVDEVIVRGTKKLKSFPAAPGIMPESVQNMLILDYGTDESLRIIQERAHELAAVLVEPVQSRRPEFVPVDFLKQVRSITAASGTALIFDEVITGFRMHPGGTQALFGIKADLASYGKVIGGGLPIGVIAGSKDYMDALDGGSWQYGDASFPEKGVTYFAGTFVRHPLALAAAKASLLHLKASGPDLQKALTRKAERIANALNAEFDQHQLPLFVAQFGSLWKIKPKEDVPYGELLFTLMREKGIHIWDGFPCFTTEAHTDDEITLVLKLFRESIREMIDGGFFPDHSTVTSPAKATVASYAFNEPPAPGARLGRDRDGNPAWFIEDPARPGNYLQIDL